MHELNHVWREQFLSAHDQQILRDLELCGVAFEWREDRSGRVFFVALGIDQQPIDDVTLLPAAPATTVHTLLHLVATALEVDVPILA